MTDRDSIEVHVPDPVGEATSYGYVPYVPDKPTSYVPYVPDEVVVCTFNGRGNLLAGGCNRTARSLKKRSPQPEPPRRIAGALPDCSAARRPAVRPQRLRDAGAAVATLKGRLRLRHERRRRGLGSGAHLSAPPWDCTCLATLNCRWRCGDMCNVQGP